ncbi:ATP-binding protein [Kitasatospora sp. NPDC058170]|uniref:ATP-binding protein n=1 Tax=Kitasatospora sp. NPDC058170 TaxID=3346364 RepID=UPI0036DEA239
MAATALGTSSGDGWEFDVPTDGSKSLPPSPRYVEALASQGYSFEAAVADLIDNSIDAGAERVAVVFLRDGDRLSSLLIVDDGQGMDDCALDTAMTIAGQERYAAAALGMYGTGLKAASMSCADSLTVISRTKRSKASGRRWLTQNARNGFHCDIVSPEYSQRLIDRYDGIIGWQGTIVRWDAVRDFDTIEEGHTDQYLNRAVDRLENYLGLYLHRFLSRGGFHIDIVIEEATTREEHDHRPVEPIDPFGYRVPGKAGYPRKFTAPIEGIGDVALTAHIWPPKNQSVGYKGIGPLQERQGFYFYRNDRLVQAGGWNSYRSAEGHLSLARVQVDLPHPANSVFSLTVKKAGVTVNPSFSRGLEKATDADGTSFAGYLHEAEAVYREAARRNEPKRKAAIPPGRGISPKLKRVLVEELPQVPGEDPIGFLWEPLSSDVLFEIDRSRRAIRLNKAYRQAVLGNRRGGFNDAPLLKSMLYLAFNDIFQKERLRAVVQDEIDLWNAVLIAAVRSEADR